MQNKHLKISLFILLVIAVFLIGRGRSQTSIEISLSALPQPQSDQPSKEIEPKSRDLANESSTYIEDPESKFQRAAEYAKKFRSPTTLVSAEASDSLFVQNNLLAEKSWKLWSHTRVIKRDADDPNTEFLARVNNFLIVSEPKRQLSDLKNFDVQNPIAVYDERALRAGIITGVIKVSTQDVATLESDLTLMHAHITSSFDSIHLYFISSTDQTFDLQNLYDSLKAKSYITKIDLEILSRPYEKF